MSVNGGALEDARKFLNQVCASADQEHGHVYPFWDYDEGRWALAHWAGVRQVDLEDISPAGIRFRWGTSATYNLVVHKYANGPGVIIMQVRPFSGGEEMESL